MQDQDICRCEPGCNIPYGYCHCGCGQKTKISDATVPKHGYVRGEPRRYLMNHNKRKTTPEYIVKDQGYETPCWVWQRYRNKKGYGMMRVYGKKNMSYSHVVYYERAKGPVPEGKQVGHRCHDEDPSCRGGDDCPHRACVRPDHLIPQTNTENGRGGRRPKLTIEQVRDIRSRPRTYGSTKALAAEFERHFSNDHQHTKPA